MLFQAPIITKSASIDQHLTTSDQSSADFANFAVKGFRFLVMVFTLKLPIFTPLFRLLYTGYCLLNTAIQPPPNSLVSPHFSLVYPQLPFLFHRFSTRNTQYDIRSTT